MKVLLVTAMICVLLPAIPHAFADVCSSFPFNSIKYGDCILSTLASQQKAWSLTIPYHSGFAQGAEDSLISINDPADACKNFSGISHDQCYKGYSEGLNLRKD